MIGYLTAETAKPVRHYLPASIELNSWEDVKPFFKELQDRVIDSVTDLEQWMKDRSELEAFLEEDSRWRYVKVSVNTFDKEAEQALEFFYKEIEPKLKSA